MSGASAHTPYIWGSLHGKDQPSQAVQTSQCGEKNIGQFLLILTFADSAYALYSIQHRKLKLMVRQTKKKHLPSMSKPPKYYTHIYLYTTYTEYTMRTLQDQPLFIQGPGPSAAPHPCAVCQVWHQMPIEQFQCQINNSEQETFHS